LPADSSITADHPLLLLLLVLLLPIGSFAGRPESKVHELDLLQSAPLARLSNNFYC
jgi:hypothetical protein